MGAGDWQKAVEIFAGFACLGEQNTWRGGIHKWMTRGITGFVLIHQLAQPELGLSHCVSDLRIF